MLRFERLKICRFASSFMGPSTSRAQDHYTTLGIKRTATVKEIKAAFYELSNKYHPDRNPEDKENASIKFQTIVNAYEVLGNAEKRKQYDSQFANPYIRDRSSIKQDFGMHERSDFSNFTYNSKDLQVSASRDFYRANALSTRLARWNKSAKDRAEKSIWEDPDVQTTIKAIKKLIVYVTGVVILIGCLMATPQLNYKDDIVTDKNNHKGKVLRPMFGC